MKIARINCIHYDVCGYCNNPKVRRRFFGLFKQPCPEVINNKCPVIETNPRPTAPTMPPSNNRATSKSYVFKP